MQTKVGHGQSVEEAFEVAVPAKSRGAGVVQTLERPPRTKSLDIAERFDGSTGDGWIAIPVAYIEARDYKREVGLSGKKAQVFRFIKA